MSPVGGPEVHQIATGSGPANSIFDAEPDFTGLGVVEGIIATVVLTQIILVVSLFLEVSLGRSTWRLSNHLAQSQLFGQLILDQITVTVVSLSTSFFTVLVHSPSMSAYPRRIVQLCLSLSNIASLTLFVSRPIGVKQLLIVFIISLAWFSVSFRNTLDGVSVSAELEWLESGQDQIKDSSPLPETTNAIVPGLACLLVILLRWRYHRKIDGIGDLGCLIIGIPLILSDVVEIRDLREKYQPHIDYDAETTFGFGQLIALLLPLAPIISAIESYTIAPPQPRNNKVSEDVPESQIGLHRYITILPAISPTILLLRKVKFVAILVGLAGTGLGLIFLLHWYYEHYATVKHISPLPGRITAHRKILHYATLWNIFSGQSSNFDYATPSLEIFPSRTWFKRASKTPPSYRRISWECSCGEPLAADFDNSNLDAIAALEQRLHGLSNTGASSVPQQPPATSGTSHGNTSQGTNSNSQSSTTQSPTSIRNRSSINMPGTSRGGTTNPNQPQSPQLAKYFELCVSVGQHTINLGEINISSVATDSQLFEKIWDRYHEIKKSNFESVLRRWFFKPDDVLFVHFGVTKRHQVGIYGKPMEIPPPEEVHQGRYHYFDCPMQPLPPMPNHIFLHYLDWARQSSKSSSNHPQVHAEDIFLSRLPKKLGSSIFTTGTGVQGSTIMYGWGVHIVERPSAFAQSVLGLASALICVIIFAFTWGFVDLSTAVGIGQFAAGVLALANAAIYFALQAYSTRLSRRTR